MNLKSILHLLNLLILPSHQLNQMSTFFKYIYTDTLIISLYLSWLIIFFILSFTISSMFLRLRCINLLQTVNTLYLFCLRFTNRIIASFINIILLNCTCFAYAFKLILIITFWFLWCFIYAFLIFICALNCTFLFKIILIIIRILLNFWFLN